MENAGHIALSRQMVIRREVQVIANNLANMNTNAYKGESMVFVEYLKKTDSGQKLSLVQDIALMRNLAEGEKVSTSNDLDLAILGKGYFAVETEMGPRYTRNGSFRLNSDGELVTARGQRVLDDNDSPIVIFGGGAVAVSRDGMVSSAAGPVGKLQVVQFEDEQSLRKMAGGLYEADGQKPERGEDYEVHQGMLERSNVVGILEMTRMTEAIRAYGGTSKVMSQEHKRQEKAIRILGSMTGI